jgi:8-oxo-dGTP pyrophosphatase MutT (NUDIX family)
MKIIVNFCVKEQVYTNIILFLKENIKSLLVYNYQDIAKQEEDFFNKLLEAKEIVFIVSDKDNRLCLDYQEFCKQRENFYDQSSSLKYSRINEKIIVLTENSSEELKAYYGKQAQIQNIDILLVSIKNIDSDLKHEKNLILNFVLEEYLEEESAMAIVFYENKILATKELIYGNEYLSLPKGHIEQGETKIETAIRECFEETNIKVEQEDLVKALEPFEIRFINHYNKFVKKKIYPFCFRVKDSGLPQAKEKWIVAVEYMDINEFLKRASYDNIKEMVLEAYELVKGI